MSIRLVQLAWRNLWRNPRRTFISVTAIALGYAMLLLFACLLNGLSRQMIDNGTRSRACRAISTCMNNSYKLSQFTLQFV